MIKKHLPALIFIIFALGLYLHNLSQSVYGGDVGDLVTAASIMGVAHPPGYPLFTLVGFLLTRLSVFHLSSAFLVGLISAFSAGIGLVAFYFLSYSLSKNKLSSFIATSVLAFSFLYWFYAEIAEVFALNSMFALILFLLALLYRSKPTRLVLVLFAFVTGLSMTNHQTIILIFPSILLLIAKPLWKSFKKSKAVLFIGLGSMLIGLIPYVYIPIASSHNPIVNWDNVHDIKSFLHLILRQDYGTFQAGLFDTPTISQRLLILKTYLFTVISQFTIPVIVLSVLGLGVLWKKDKIVSLSLLLGFILTGPLFIGYAGFPLLGSFYLGVYERFFVLSSVILLIPFSVGLLWLATCLSRLLRRDIYVSLFQVIFLFIPLTLLFYNFPKTDLSHLMIGDTYAEDMLNALPKNTLLMFSGDTLVFNTWYVHYVKHVRPDVAIYNFGGDIQNKAATTLVTNSKTKLTTNKLDTLVASLIEYSKVRPVFSSVLLEPTTDSKKITWIPYGLMYQLSLSSDPLPDKDTYVAKQKEIWSSFHLPTQEDSKKEIFHSLTIAEFPTGYSNAALATGTFLYSHYHDVQDAVTYYKRAIALDPNNAKAYELLGAYYVGVGGQCPAVVEDLTTAISLNPFEKIPYFLLYATYKDCFHREDMAKGVAAQFTAVFQQDFAKEMKKQVNNIFSE